MFGGSTGVVIINDNAWDPFNAGRKVVNDSVYAHRYIIYTLMGTE
jgi:hypothetical protein